MSKINVTVEYDSSESAMGFQDSFSLESVDLEESIDKYESMLLNEILKEWPGASVTIDATGNDIRTVDGDQSDILDNIIGNIWAAFQWVVMTK